jgi:hypothetical protein
MASKTPLLLVDNVLDTIQQYREGELSADSEASGQSVHHVADYRRERTWWQPGAASGAHHITVFLGSGIQATCDYVFIDRGHEGLLGTNLLVQRSTDGVSWTTVVTLAVPADLDAGGDPESSTMCVTEEGALYSLFSAAGPYSYWRLKPVDDVQCKITGAMLGKRHQLANYSGTFDEDQASRIQRSETSDAGYKATGTTYSFRNLEIRVATVGVTEYNTTMRELRRLLFELHEPAIIAMNYGFKPERAGCISTTRRRGRCRQSA